MADERLGASFSIDVTELKTGLKQANKLIRESESEFKAAAAGMDDWTKSEDGLRAKIKSLTDTTDVQREKVKALKQEYNRLIDEGLDPTSQQAVELRTKINNEEAALKSNEKELEKQKEALKNLGAVSEETGEKFEKLGSVVKKVGEVAAVALAAAGAAVVALGKSAIESYAEYEQLVGGVDTLFKESSKTIQKYADDAYKAAGISSNEYMTQATSFSASLIQSLGGDTAKAAEYTNKAIVDMSDNVNKMGSDMESVQNAYQGFAKQNYTMLDNLKLGYGGTKQEMERLIADANKLREAQGLAGDLTIEKYSDVIEAIHLVQDEMGITGTTAKEAATTIQGSVGMMKAAWSNLVTGLANENADIDKLITNLLESFSAVGENLIPRIKVTLKGIVKLISELAPMIAQELPSIINEVLPDLLEGAVSLVQALVDVLPELIVSIGDTLVQQAPTLLKSAGEIITTLIQGIMESLPELISLGAELLTTIAEGFGDNIPELIENGLIAIQEFAEHLAESSGELIEAGVELIVKLVEGLAESLPVLIEYIPTIVSTIADIINDNMPTIIGAAIEIIWSLIKGLIKAIPSLIENIPQIIEAIVKVWEAFQWVNLGKTIIKGIVKGAKALLKNIKEIPKKVWTTLKDGGFGSLGKKAVTWGKDMIEGFIKGIKAKLKKIKDTATNIAKDIKKILGFSVPEEGPMSDADKWMPDMIDLMSKGIDENKYKLTRRISSLANDINSTMTGANSGNLGYNASEKASVGGGVVVYQTNNYSQAHSRYELYKSKQQTAAAVRLAMAGGV